MQKIKYSKLNIDRKTVYEEGSKNLSTFRQGVKDGLVWRMGEFNVEDAQKKIRESINKLLGK